MVFLYILVILCGILALAYGAYAGRTVLSADAGSDRMQEIAGAIQEGARAYLNRQYTTIAIAGVVGSIATIFFALAARSLPADLARVRQAQ